MRFPVPSKVRHTKGVQSIGGTTGYGRKQYLLAFILSLERLFLRVHHRLVVVAFRASQAFFQDLPLLPCVSLYLRCGERSCSRILALSPCLPSCCVGPPVPSDLHRFQLQPWWIRQCANLLSQAFLVSLKALGLAASPTLVSKAIFISALWVRANPRKKLGVSRNGCLI